MRSKSIRKPLERAAAWIGLAGFLLLTGCQSAKGDVENQAPPLPQVGTITVESRSVELTTELPGRASAYRVAEIRPQVNGLVQKRLFEEGSDVKAGRQLYQIDPAPFQVEHDSARASLAKAQANLPSIRSRAERYKELLAENAVSRQDYDDAAAALELAKADIEYWKTKVEAARINLEYTSVDAPFSGRIGRSLLRTGSLVTAYQTAPLATLQQLDPIYVDVVQSSAELLRMRRDVETGRIGNDLESRRKVDIFLEDGTPYPIEGTLQFADITVDPTTGSYSLRIVVPNPDYVLLPGMYVRAVVKEGVVPQAVLVPQQGVSRTPKGEPIALVVDEANKVRQRMLTLGRAIGDQWLIVSGVSAGDRLIVEGMLNVRPGMEVAAVSLDPTGEEAETSASTAATAGLN